MLLSGPVVTPCSPDASSLYDVSAPCVVTCPRLALSVIVTQKAPSGPVVMPTGPPPSASNSVIWPWVLMRPILETPYSVNQRAPSGPLVIQMEPLSAVGMLNSVTLPSVVERPILLPFCSTNQ